MEREESEPGHIVGAPASSFAETVRSKKSLLKGVTSERKREGARLVQESYWTTMQTSASPCQPMGSSREKNCSLEECPIAQKCLNPCTNILLSHRLWADL